MNETEALVAIAGVASVFWTGGLIVRQLNPVTVSNGLVHGMGYFIFAALSALAALALDDTLLMFGMFLAFAYYFNSYAKALLDFQKEARGLKPLPDWAQDKKQYLIGTVEHFQYAGYLCVMFVPILFWPNQLTVAIVGILAIYAGYRGVLPILSTAPVAAPVNYQLQNLKQTYEITRDTNMLDALKRISQQLEALRQDR